VSAPARVPAGSPEGGRFATAECPTTYRLLAAVRAVEPREGTGGRYHPVPAPKCPHGHYARWAARNCKPCR
jgi:hypothetical protein